jgi:putative membrane protein
MSPALLAHTKCVTTRYDRYWMGRSCWSDVIRDSRALGRVIWFHVPPYMEADRSGSKEEMAKMMKEKRMALDLVEG